MKKKCFLLAALLFFTEFAFSSDFTFSVDKIYSVQNGIQNEFVYVIDDYSDLQKLSELNWQQKFNFLLGASFQAKSDDFLVKTDFLYKVASPVGFMTDSDWLNENDWSMKTDFSTSDNSVNYNIASNTKFSWKIRQKHEDVFKLNIFSGLNYSYTNYTAQNGYGYYGDSDNSASGKNVWYYDADAAFYDVGFLCPIDYRRHDFDLLVGLNFDFDITPVFNLNFDVAVAPLTFVFSYDYHYSDLAFDFATVYRDSMLGLLSHYYAKLSCVFNIAPVLSVGIDFNVDYLAKIFGLTYTANYISGLGLTAFSDSATSIAACSSYSYGAKLYFRYSF